MASEIVLKQLIIVIAILHVVFSARKIPSYINMCKRSEPDLGKCMLNSITDLTPYLIKGIPEFDLQPLNRMEVPSIDATANVNSGQFAIHLENGVLTGLENFEFARFNANIDTYWFSFELIHKEVVYAGPYKLEGQILLFNVSSHGILNATFKGVRSSWDWYGTPTIKEGKDHVVYEKMGVNTTIESGNVHFENLFDGNPALTESANQAFNDNMDILKEELYPIMNDIIGTIVKGSFNRIFDLFPVDELFPRD